MLGLGLQTPILLIGLIALGIPLAIHLLSKSRGRLVPFAHTTLIKIKASPRLRQLRLTQWWLLLLRCLILLLATLIVAKLYWHNTSSPQQHILLTEDWLNHATQVQRQQLRDTNLQQTWILLNAPNRRLSWQDIQQWPKKEQQASVTSLNVWQEVANYQAGIAANTPLSVYTTNGFNQFIGQQVAIGNSVKWQIINKATSAGKLQQNLIVMFDKNNRPQLGYLTAAIKALNIAEQLDIKVVFKNLDDVNPSSLEWGQPDSIILLSDLSVSEFFAQFPEYSNSSVMTKEQLGDMAQVQFPLSLFELLFEQQDDEYQLENLRLSAQQITRSNVKPSDKPISRAHLSFNNHSLNLWLWILLVLAVCLERTLSERASPIRKTASGAL